MLCLSDKVDGSLSDIYFPSFQVFMLPNLCENGCFEKPSKKAFSRDAAAGELESISLDFIESSEGFFCNIIVRVAR